MNNGDDCPTCGVPVSFERERTGEPMRWIHVNGAPMHELICIDRPDRPSDKACTGTVELRESLSGTGMPIARCDGHWSDRLDWQQEHNRRYPVHAPPDFDPSYAGERWDEED